MAEAAPVFSKTIQAENCYLHFPVKNGNEKVTFQILQNGEMVREFNIELAQNETPDWWAFYEIDAFKGKEIELRAVDGLVSEAAVAWLGFAITQGDAIREADDLYNEKHRPQFHFTTRHGWNNDPNGMVYADGAWHLYYQYNPFGITWGNMHWGHAVSKDLVHWQEQPVALYQKSLKDMAFSGGGFVDWKNSAGYQQGEHPPLMVAFTSTGRGECLAYSSDGGTTFTEFAENPVIRHQGRDPKIIWYEPGQKWVMMIYEEIDEERGYAIYDSRDLKQWNRLSFLPGYFECPEFYELPVEGDPKRRYWVISGSLWERSRSACTIGVFDGVHFKPLHENVESHSGPHFYAAQIFSDAPQDRRIMIGWLAGPLYPDEMPFSQGMTVPLELSLRETSAGLRLCYWPVKELETLRESELSMYETTFEHANRLLAQASALSELLEVNLSLHLPDEHSVLFDVGGNPVFYHPRTGDISFAGKQAHLAPGLKELELRVLVDRSVTEVFANQGAAAFAAMTTFDAGRLLKLEGSAWVKQMQIYKLRSIW